MLAGLIRDDERRVRDGIPGLSDMPGVGRMFGHSRDERQQTDIILVLTPRIVRVLELTEEDLRAFQIGRDAGAPLGPPHHPALRLRLLAELICRCPAALSPRLPCNPDRFQARPQLAPILPPAPPPLQPPPNPSQPAPQ